MAAKGCGRGQIDALFALFQEDAAAAPPPPRTIVLEPADGPRRIVLEALADAPAAPARPAGRGPLSFLRGGDAGADAGDDDLVTYSRPSGSLVRGSCHVLTEDGTSSPTLQK